MFQKKQKKQEYVELRGILGIGKDYHVYHMKRVDYLLFDTRCEGYGGSGKAFDWSLLARYDGETPFLLSGGIRPESAESLRRFRHPRLAGIDLNSGFEREPGLKDAEKLREFVRRVRTAWNGG